MNYFQVFVTSLSSGRSDISRTYRNYVFSLPLLDTDQKRSLSLTNWAPYRGGTRRSGGRCPRIPNLSSIGGELEVSGQVYAPFALSLLKVLHERGAPQNWYGRSRGERNPWPYGESNHDSSVVFAII